MEILDQRILSGRNEQWQKVVTPMANRFASKVALPQALFGQGRIALAPPGNLEVLMWLQHRAI